MIRLHFAAPLIDMLPAFFASLAGSCINLPFISITHQEDGVAAVCCVDAENQVRLKALFDIEPLGKDCISYKPGVGLLSLFPHHSSMKIFAQALRALSRKKIRVLGFGSSIGALTYVLDYSCLDASAVTLKACFNLKGNHSPFRAEFVVSQATLCRPERTE